MNELPRVDGRHALVRGGPRNLHVVLDADAAAADQLRKKRNPHAAASVWRGRGRLHDAVRPSGSSAAGRTPRFSYPWLMAARASTSSAKRSPGGIEMPPPPPVPPRTASRSPPLPPPDILTAGDAKGTGTTADPLPSTGHVARGSKQTPGWPGTEPAGSRPALRLETAAPTLSPVLSISSNPTEDSYPSTMASPSTDPPDDAEVLNDGSRLYRLPRQCMRYTQRLDGSWKQWGPMMLPDGDSTSSEQVCPSTDMADMKLKLHEAESRAAQLQAAVGQAARQGKAQCEQFEQRLREMEADVIQSVALGSDERTRVQIERLQTRVHHLEIEAEDLRTEAMVARAASDKNRAAMQKAKRAAETSHKQSELDQL